MARCKRRHVARSPRNLADSCPWNGGMLADRNLHHPHASYLGGGAGVVRHEVPFPLAEWKRGSDAIRRRIEIFAIYRDLRRETLRTRSPELRHG